MTDPHRTDRGSHPRPLLQRDGWISLDGPWDFALDPEAAWVRPADVVWAGTIRVPFAPETRASGIHQTGFYRACWYRRRVDLPAVGPGERVRLNFGAVDYDTTVWADGQMIATHEGGYTLFHTFLTSGPRGESVEVVVRAEDDPFDLTKPRGKQDWQLRPHSIWYPRTTGIWQPVWLEVLPAAAIAHIRWTPNMERWELGLEVALDGERRDDLRLRVCLRVGDLLLADDTYQVVAGEVHRRIALSDPGIDDYRNELLWSPASPTLINASIELLTPRGGRLDAVDSYTALRSIGIQGDRFVLNGRPLQLRMVLDQGYWPETGVTAPDDAALRRDIELVKAMGFNGVRKHQKIEDPRFLYWADVLGLLVWEEMPSAPGQVLVRAMEEVQGTLEVDHRLTARERPRTSRPRMASFSDAFIGNGTNNVEVRRDQDDHPVRLLRGKRAGHLLHHLASKNPRVRDRGAGRKDVRSALGR